MPPPADLADALLHRLDHDVGNLPLDPLHVRHGLVHEVHLLEQYLLTSGGDAVGVAALLLRFGGDLGVRCDPRGLGLGRSDDFLRPRDRRGFVRLHERRGGRQLKCLSLQEQHSQSSCSKQNE